jgi:cyclopropane fatty-acyl-phospholipid synthase-like methyltransferase
MGNSNELTFDDFKRLASDQSLSKYEKIGFPNSYRKDHEANMFKDILTKLPMDQVKNKTIVDIGCGCSDLVYYLIDLCKANNHKLILIDSEEMLSHIPDQDFIIKYAGYYPNIDPLFELFQGKVDFVLSYSVFHYIFNEGNMYQFLHKTVDLLTPGGHFLLGDIPNYSKRERFLNSEEGKLFLSKTKETANLKGATNHNDTTTKIDDAIVMAILTRLRNYQCETYLLPQSDQLPMANRREDILIVKK